MTAATERLMDFVGADDCFDIAPADLLGTANAHALGSPHDAMYPLQRFVHWMGDDDITIARS
jgi:hypothetical protein